MRYFNTEGTCYPEKHYMVDISNKLVKIEKMVEGGKYFVINRGRQYGKTTTLSMLNDSLRTKYLCISLSFEGVGETFFASEEGFCQGFVGEICQSLRFSRADSSNLAFWKEHPVRTMQDLSWRISDFCLEHSVVLMIDEVDKASNFRVFLDFLGMLRSKYLARNGGRDYSFQSVILVGIYDIKNIKLKMVRSGNYTLREGEWQYNSPWNIAAKFTIDMSFSPKEIGTMLWEYDREHHAGMDIPAVSSLIHEFTGGYPYLVTAVCKLIDEQLSGNWSYPSLLQGMKILSEENNTLFDDILKNMHNHPDFAQLLYQLLIEGRTVLYEPQNPMIQLGEMFGILKKRDTTAVISNKIFEVVITNYFIYHQKRTVETISSDINSEVIHDGRFDMALCMQKFASYFQEIFILKPGGHLLESECRMIFLIYIKSLLNGVGFYHIESQTTDDKRMDIVVNYLHEEFIIELKTWHGEQKHQKAYEQLLGYMTSRRRSEGYLMTFDFSVHGVQHPDPRWISLPDGKRIYDITLRPHVQK
jgi:hypothetical protein